MSYIRSNYIKRNNNIVLLASAFDRSSTYIHTSQLLHFKQFHTAIAMQGMMHGLPMCISQSYDYSRVKVTV